MKKLFLLVILILAGYYLYSDIPAESLTTTSLTDREEKFYRIGEKIVFELTWFGINAGWATLEVKERLNYDGKEVIRIVSTAQSNKFVSVFYSVDDRTETFIDPLERYPYRFTIRQREGRYRSDKETIFDQENNKAVFIKDGKSQVFDVFPKVQDALSSFYYLRTLELKVGNPVYIKIFDNGKNYEAKVEILRKEKIDTPIGSFNTICVKPMLKTEGIFQRKGDVYIWLTDDDRKMPVMMKSSVKVGDITAMIIWSGPTPSPIPLPSGERTEVRGGNAL